MLALRTVWSAPESTSRGTSIHVPSAALASPRMTGRWTPSLPRSQAPRMSIDAGHPFFGHDEGEATVVVRVRRPGESHRFLGGRGREQLLTGHADDLAAVGLVDLRPLRL